MQDRDEDRVAGEVAKQHQLHPYNLGLTVGDNCYPAGVRSADDPQWGPCFDQPYGRLGIKFYATLGDHDYRTKDGPRSEIEHSRKNPLWQMPDTYYTFTVGPVRFFALDTALDISEADNGSEALKYWEKEREWLDHELDTKTGATWTVVYGHKPIYSTGWHGPTPYLVRTLLPVLTRANRVDLFLSGHDHDLEHLRINNSKLELYVCGGGGGELLFRVRTHLWSLPSDVQSVYYRPEFGFCDIRADSRHMQISLVDLSGNHLSPTTLTK